ncbi:MAG: FISUMP domain-containing protein, partial [Bacteroidota bacterium]
NSLSLYSFNNETKVNAISNMSEDLFEKPVVFINYRRSDSESEAGRLASDLDRIFGNRFSFQDIDDIQSGDLWIDKLIDAGLNAQVILVIIGESWLVKRNNKVRLFDEGDWVRRELLAAIEAKKIIIPVLIDGARLPKKNQIPPELHPLLRHQAFPIRKARWKHDIVPLIQDIKNITQHQTLAEKQKRSNSMRRFLGWGVFSILALLTIFLLSGIIDVSNFSSKHGPTDVSDSASVEANSDLSENSNKDWKRMKDLRIWMTTNLNVETVGSWCYDNDPENCKKYGRLYTWQAAKEACPKGWSLPSIKEWQKLTRSYGYGGKEVYASLIEDSSSGFNIQFSGELSVGENQFENLNRKAIFWTRDTYNSRQVQTYVFDRQRGVAVSGGTTSKDIGYACRCIRDN